MFLGAGILALLLALGSGVVVVTSHFKDRAFDRREASAKAERAKAVEENAKLVEERTELLEKIKANEAREAELSIEAARLREVVEAGGARLQDLNRRLEDEDERYTKDVASNASDTRSVCERWLHNCETAKRLRIKPATEPCNCSAIGK
jgi:chromosome segregation ATPase